MDLQRNPEDIESYLEALRKLYSLVVITDRRQSLQNHTSRDEILDEKARSLLKDLLDDAAEKILKVTSEVIASSLGLSNTHSFTQQPESQDSLKPALLLTNAQFTSSDVVKHSDKDLHQAADLTINYSVPDDEMAKSVASEQSDVSTSLAEFQNRKKRCRICQRSSAKQLKSIEKRKSSSEETEDIKKGIASPYSKPWHQVDEQEKVQAFDINTIKADSSYDREMEERILEFQFNPSGNVSPTCLFNSDATGIVKAGALQNFTTGSGKKNEDNDFISKDASDAIKTIESRISALKVGGKQVGPFRKQIADHQGPFKFGASAVSGTGSISPVMQKKVGLLSQGDQTQIGDFVVGRNDPHSLSVNRKVREPKDSTLLNQTSRHKVNPLMEFNLPNQSVSYSPSLSPWTAELSKSICQSNKEENGIYLESDLFSQVEKLIDGQRLQMHKGSLVPVEISNAKIVKVETLTQNNHVQNQTNSVQGLRIPPHCDKKDRKNSLLDKSPNKTDKAIMDADRGAKMEMIKKVGRTKLPVPTVGSTDTVKLDNELLAVNAGSKQIHTRTKMSITGKGLSHPTTMRQTVRGKRSDHFRVPPVYPDQMKEGMGGVKKKYNHKGYQRMSLSDQQESIGTTSGPTTSSSSWTTQQGNTSYYDSEEHSVSDQSQSTQYSGTNTSSESKEGYYVSASTRGHHSGGTSYSDDEMYSLPSCTPSQADSNSSSKNGEYFPSDQSSSLGFSDRSQDRYSRRYRSTDRKRPTKQIGRLKKLKDKLAIIFHHHHHHHHHHYHDDADHSDQKFHANNGASLPKHAAKMFNRKGEAYGEQAAEKLRKPMVHNVPNKKQGTNLHRLVNGFVRHVRHSNKSKKSKGSIDHKPKEHQYASKKLVKKVHWWQLLRRRRKMKMPKRPKVKLGHGDKKSKLQAVPTLKWC